MSGYNTLMRNARAANTLSAEHRNTEAHYSLGVSLGRLAETWEREAAALAIQACRKGFRDPYQDRQYGQIGGQLMYLTGSGVLWRDRQIDCRASLASLAHKEHLLLQALIVAMSPAYRATTPRRVPFSDLPNTTALYSDADARRHFRDAVSAMHSASEAS